MSRQLPAQPNLEYLRKQAKELAKAKHCQLAEAQHALAQDYGFATWTELKEHVQATAQGTDPLQELGGAVVDGDAAEVRLLLKRHPELRPKIDDPLPNYGFGLNALYAAVQRSDRQTIDVLLEAGADINKRSDWWAGGFGVLDECSHEMAPYLIERGAVIDAHSAARLGMFDKLKELVAAGPAVVHARGGDGQTPLHYASSIEIAEFLLEHGADIDARDIDHESTPAQYMLRVTQRRHFPRDRDDIARHLVARGCRTDLLMAAALGDLDLARRHLDADPNRIRMSVSQEWFPMSDPRAGGTIYIWVFGWYRTAHTVARDFGHEEMFRFLMDRSPVDLKLLLASELGDEGLFQQMLASRPGMVQSLSDSELCNLPNAAQNNNAKAVSLMLAAGWPPSARGRQNATALHWACFNGNAAMVRNLIEHRADVEAREDDYKMTPLGWALYGSANGWHRQTGDYAASVEALLDAGAAAPKDAEVPEASDAVREVLRRREGTNPPLHGGKDR